MSRSATGLMPRCYLACLVVLAGMASALAQDSSTLPQPHLAGESSPESALRERGNSSTEPMQLPAELALADLQAIALKCNPTIPAAQAMVVQEQGLVRQAGLLPNPTIGYIRVDPNKPNQSETQGGFISQDIVTAGKLRKGSDAARYDVSYRSWQVEAQVGRVLNDVRIRYIDVLGVQETMRVTQELVRIAEAGLKLTRQLQEAQRGTRLDVLQAEQQLAAIQVTARDAQYRYQAAWRQLTSVVGMPNLSPRPLQGDLCEDVPRFDFRAAAEELLANSPVLHAQQALVGAAQADIRLARALAYPNLNVQFLIQHDQIFKYDQLTSFVSLPLPLYNRNQGNIQSAFGLLKQQVNEYERIRLALLDQLSISFEQYSTLRNQADQMKNEILPRAQEILNLTTSAYELRQVDFLRVLNARQSYFSSRLAYVDALTSLNKVVVEIEGLELLGALNPTEIGTALQAQAPGMGPASPRSVLLQQLQSEANKGSQSLPGGLQGSVR